jgi:4-alpha-glucanotransferase
VFALHPLYLRVQALSERLPEDIKEEIQKAKNQLDKNVMSPLLDVS